MCKNARVLCKSLLAQIVVRADLLLVIGFVFPFGLFYYIWTP